jgi:hypothetical protein
MDKNKIIAQEILKAIGGDPIIKRHWDTTNKKHVDIYCSDNQPYHGITSCATIGLSDIEIGLSSQNKKLRIEIVGACSSEKEELPNILSTVAFEIMDKNECHYGYILQRVVELYYPNIEMKHIYLLSPFLWEELKTIELENMNIAWLLMIPISDDEKNYAQKNGVEALEVLFEKANIDIFNLNRSSVI